MFKPYNKLSGQAIVINLEAKNRFPHMENSLLRAGVHFFYIMPLVWLTELSSGLLTANSFSADVTRCLGQTLEICGGCNEAGQAQTETINPDLTFNCDMGLRKGSDRCKISVKRKGGNVDPTEEPTACILPVRVTEEEIDFWPVHYFTGYWAYSNLNLIDSLGLEKAMEIAGPYMENAGATVALRLKKELGIEGDDARTIGAIMGFLNDMSAQTGEFTLFSPDTVKKTVNQCPFAEPCMCSEYRSIAEGVCRAVNPKYAFRYECMMSRGESQCKWVVSKK